MSFRLQQNKHRQSHILRTRSIRVYCHYPRENQLLTSFIIKTICQILYHTPLGMSMLILKKKTFFLNFVHFDGACIKKLGRSNKTVRAGLRITENQIIMRFLVSYRRFFLFYLLPSCKTENTFLNTLLMSNTDIRSGESCKFL